MLADITPLLADRPLPPDEVRAAMAELLDPKVPGARKAEFLSAWTLRGETAAELAACAETLLPQAVDSGLHGTWNGKPLLDCCGTGGGGLNLLNVSTGIVFILAALNVPVVKHGNRGVTKKSGSADVLEALGIKIDLTPTQTRQCLYEVGCVFLFAPAYHTSFAVLGPVRKQLAFEGKRTIFNLLGPLLNPARPDARLVGVFKHEHVALYQEALEIMKCPRFTVACGTDANSGRMLGEVSAHGETVFGSTLLDPQGGPFRKLTGEVQEGRPQDVGYLLVENANDSASRITAVLNAREKGFALDTLLINAAIAAWTQGVGTSLSASWKLCEEAVSSGQAAEKLREWQEFSRKIR